MGSPLLSTHSHQADRTCFQEMKGSGGGFLRSIFTLMA